MPVWLRALIFLVTTPGTIVGLVPWFMMDRNLRPRTENQLVQAIALVIVAAGLGVLLWCARDFARRGRGTPAPYDPPKALIVAGLYRFTRNPMYVGVVTMLVGEALWFQSRNMLIYAAAFALAFHLRVLFYEEPKLTHLFGDEYAQYRARVSRWIPFR
jgi:protein-S-isoprenylcysteine O-methyltransferase Ste14